MSSLKTRSFLNKEGVKCWKIQRGSDKPVIVVPSSTNKKKYVVHDGETPRRLKDIQAEILNGEYDHFADRCTKVAPDSQSVPLPGQWEVSPPGKSIWEDSVPASSLLALLASGWSADVLREEINRTLDNEGLLVNGKADEVTAKAIFDHHRKK